MTTAAVTPTMVPAPVIPLPDAIDGVVNFALVVEEVVPHDPSAYTQGLVWDGNRLFESAGRYGESTLREVDPATGEVRRLVRNDPAVFAEGLELIDDRLYQLTWREEVAFVWDAGTFDLLDTFSYEGEGWGLCFDGDRLVMSDGSATLRFRDPADFTETGSVTVVRDGRPVERLNELECLDGLVLANIWQSTEIVVIDPATGAVVGSVTGGATLLEQARAEYENAEVFNGIAFDEATGRFLVTGKHWPFMFVVRLEPT